MARDITWRVVYLVLADYIIPIPLTVAMYYRWIDHSESILYARFIILMGLVFGYIVPGIAANVFRLWKFTWPLQWKNIFITHGFIYTSFFSLIFYLSFPEQIELNLLNILRIVSAMFAMFAIVCSHHEIVGIKQGMIISYNHVAAAGRSPVERVANFGFFSFGVLGASFAVAGLYAYDQIVLNGMTDINQLAALFAACFIILVIGSSPYFIKERKQIAKNRKIT